MRRMKATAPLTIAVVAAIALGWHTSAAHPVQQRQPGWMKSEAELFAIAERVRAGRDLTPDAWPGGARVAVLLSFDVDNETLDLAGSGVPAISDLSQGEYGARVGLRRVIEVLDRHDVPASFFIPAISLALAPEMADAVAASGRHEIAVHGWVHESGSALSAERERDMIERSIAAIERRTGERPVGFRAPSWDVGPNTIGLVRELGFLYDSSLMADDRPYELLERGEPTGLVELPVEWILDDYPLLMPLGNRYSAPRDVLQVWIDEFEGAYEEGTMFLLTLHPHVIGHRSRIVVLEELIEHIRARPGVWFATHRQAAEYVAERGL